MQHHTNNQEKGQAMVELALVLPLLLVLLLAVGYFGHVISAQQNLNAAARASAREMALESTNSNARRMSGAYLAEANAETFLAKAQSNLTDILGSANLSTKATTQFSLDKYKDLAMNWDSRGQLSKVNEHLYSFRWQETVDASGPDYISPQPKDRNNQTPESFFQLKFGLGVLFYGGTLQYDLDELDPIARFIFNLSSDPTIKVGATSLMPAELPLRAQGHGLLEINPWIESLIKENPRTSKNYPNLIDTN